MEEISIREQHSAVLLSSLAQEARMYSEAAALNMLQLGRVLTEAKAIVKHGEWQNWVKDNAHMSETQAQYLMRAFTRFGNVPAIESVEKSKIFKMLSLPSGTEEQFMEDNNVSDMSARQVEEAVRKVREDYETKLAEEKRARSMAEQKALELERKPAEIPDSVLETIKSKEDEIKRYKGECERLTDFAKNAMQDKSQLSQEKIRLERELQENEEMLTTQQQEIDRMQGELFAAQSTIARGDAEREVSEQLTADELGRAARTFLGIAAQMPYMGSRFATMNGAEISDFSEWLSAIEDWCVGSRNALNTVEGVIVHE